MCRKIFLLTEYSVYELTKTWTDIQRQKYHLCHKTNDFLVPT